jgi:hypothetical protein
VREPVAQTLVTWRLYLYSYARNETEGARGYHVLPCDRDHLLLMPPALQDWLPECDLDWFILDVVTQMALTKIERADRADGWESAAYRPATLVALRCLSAMFLQIARPNPVPCRFPVVKNGSKRRGRDCPRPPPA